MGAAAGRDRRGAAVTRRYRIPIDEAEIGGDCTCTVEIAGPTDIDPPDEVRVDPFCPEHGWRDADRERDERIDRELMEGDR